MVQPRVHRRILFQTRHAVLVQLSCEGMVNAIQSAMSAEIASDKVLEASSPVHSKVAVRIVRINSSNPVIIEWSGKNRTLITAELLTKLWHNHEIEAFEQ